jgi:adenylate kinase family enzyme
MEASEQNRVLYIETGALLRGFSKVEGYTQQKTAECMNGGGLLPAFLPVYIWTNALVEQFTGTEHLILDGLARRIEEAPVLDEALKFYGREDYQLVVLELSDESARERLKLRGRGDDAEAQKRIDWYKEHVQPVIAAFEGMGRTVHHVDGEPSIESIHEEILRRLNLA